MVSKLKECKSSFESLATKYSKAKAELYSIDKKIREAEKNAESEYIQSLRRKKNEKEDVISDLHQEIASLNIEIEQAKDRIKTSKQKK